MNVLNCNGLVLDLREPKVMGILNITPDSFYDGGKFDTLDKAMKQAILMVESGVDIIDIGAASSRPGAQMLEPEEEIKRLKEILPELVLNFPELHISVDTFWSKVADFALSNGAHIINDISAFSIDPELINVISSANIPYILMHMKGVPKDMQNSIQYENVLHEMMQFFIEKLRILSNRGLKDIIIDPGFGFGKTIDHNYTILKKLELFRILDKPMLVGLSRKSMIYKLFESDPSSVLSASSALNLQALLKGAKILRVHDVKEARQMIELYKYLK